jgi:hypothetical protein
MLHAQNAAPLPHHCRTVILFFFFREIDRIFRVLYITYTKTLIKGPFWTPCVSHESTRQRRSSDAAAARHFVHPAL